MRIKCYCNLYVSSLLEKRKNEVIKRLMERKIQPDVTVITLAQGEQNQLEFFSTVFLKQHYYDEKELFVVGLASGEMDAAMMVADITQEVLNQTGTTDIKQYILHQQKLFKEGTAAR